MKYLLLLISSLILISFIGMGQSNTTPVIHIKSVNSPKAENSMKSLIHASQENSKAINEINRQDDSIINNIPQLKRIKANKKRIYRYNTYEQPNTYYVYINGKLRYKTIKKFELKKVQFNPRYKN